MSVSTIDVAAVPERVFAVLADAQRYADWVVGTRAVTEVDERFPERGSRFGARVSLGPVVTDAVTTVLESEEPRRLVLRTRAKRVGGVQIELELEERGPGTVVTMREHALGSPLARAALSLGDPLLAARNRTSLQRLKQLVERGA